MQVVRYERPEFLNNANGKSHFYTHFYLDAFQPRPFIGHVLFGASKIPCDYKVDGNTNKVMGYPQPCLEKIGHSASMYRPEEEERQIQTSREIHFSIAAFFDSDRTLALLGEHEEEFPNGVEQYTRMFEALQEAMLIYNKHDLFLSQTHMLAFLRSLYGEIPLQKFYSMHVTDLFNHVKHIITDGATALTRRTFTRMAPLSARSAPDTIANINDASTSTGGDEADGGGGSMTNDDDFPVLALDFNKLLALHKAQTERAVEDAAKVTIAQSARQVEKFLWGNSMQANRQSAGVGVAVATPLTIRDPELNGIVIASYEPSQILLKPFNTHALSTDDWCVLLVYSILWSAFDTRKHFYLDIEDIIRARNTMQLHFICDTNDIAQALETLVKQQKVVLSFGVGLCIEASQVKSTLQAVIEAREKGIPAASPNISLAVHYNQEESVFRTVSALLSTKKHVDKSRHDRALEFVTDFLSASDITLDEAQKKAMRCYATQKLLTLQGRGGTGKTFLTVLLAYYARIYDGKKEVYLFTGFTNNSVNGLRSAILKHPLNYGCSSGDKPMTAKNCYFLTMDHVMHKYVHGGEEVPKFTRVFIDEAAMASTRNFFAALSVIDPATATVMMDGDPNQLEAISAGSNFSDLVAHLKEPHNIHLQYIHRTSQLALKAALDAILRGEIEGLVDDATSEHSFQTRYSYSDTASFRSLECLQTTARVCWETLKEIDPQRIRHKQTQLLCPFRMHVSILVRCCQAYYSHKCTQLLPETIAEWAKDTLAAVTTTGATATAAARQTQNHELRVGSKVVFRVTNKNDKHRRKDNTYCNGTSGIITELYDVDRDATPDGYEPTAEDRVKSTLQELAHRRKRVMIVDGTYTIEYTSTAELYSIVQPGDAITVDKSQCQEYETVLCFFPHSDRILNERNRLYTACSRAKNQCYLIISPLQLKNMLRNGRTPSNSNIRMWLPTLTSNQ